LGSAVDCCCCCNVASSSSSSSSLYHHHLAHHNRHVAPLHDAVVFNSSCTHHHVVSHNSPLHHQATKHLKALIDHFTSSTHCSHIPISSSSHHNQPTNQPTNQPYHCQYRSSTTMGSSLTKFLTSLWFTNRNLRVVVLGLDAAGKTTALYRMHLGEVVHTIPTIGFNVETIKLHNCTITAWDVGGQSRVCLPSSSLISFASQYYNTNQQYQFVSLTDSLAHTRISLLSALSIYHRSSPSHYHHR
jgi:hypothetical protein